MTTVTKALTTSANSMETFHIFPRLPFELRIQIWAFVTKPRVLKVRKTWHRKEGYWSPTPTPAVVNTSRESREYCSYRKAFIIESSPRYIWVNFNSDIIQMRSSLISQDCPEISSIRHMRIQLFHDGLDEVEEFYHIYSHRVRDYPALNAFDLLVFDGLSPQWTDFIKETYWGTCPRSNVRIIDAHTGEWIDEETSGPYEDYLDIVVRGYSEPTRIVDDSEEEDGRLEAMHRLQIPLPRIDLKY